MKAHYCGLVVVIAGMILAGCDGKERELEMKNAQLTSDRDSLRVVIQTREQYFDDVVGAINEVYAKLEGVREGEEELRRQTGEGEGTVVPSSLESRQHLFDQLKEIGTALDESRKDIAKLEAKIGSMNHQVTGLNGMIDNLKKTLEEREDQIAMLNERITGLEGDVAEKTRVIAQRDSVIDSKQNELNTVYYIIGTRSELEEMGVISDEGGFLWGLLGSTPVLSSGVNEEMFRRLDKTTDRVIAVDGEIEEIIPKRDQNYFSSQAADENHSDLQILDPGKFWQDKFLVIVKG